MLRWVLVLFFSLEYHEAEQGSAKDDFRGCLLRWENEEHEQEKSLETPRQTGFNNSLFTVFLERGLRGGADMNRDKVITAREIYDFVHQGVTNASGGRQHPVMWGKFDGNMAVIKW